MKKEKAIREASTIFDNVEEQLQVNDKAVIILERNDFKKELSTNVGFGFQDLKKKYKILLKDLMVCYNVKFQPIINEENIFDFGAEITIKKMK